MSHSSSQRDALNRAFQLAYFIHPDRDTAINVLISALEKLDVAVAAQDKRLYYTPSSSVKSNGSRYKVSFAEDQVLQALIFIVSEAYEIKKELGMHVSKLNHQDITVYFLKHLIQITIRRNSFYVALGISRFLHDYSTLETMDIY